MAFGTNGNNAMRRTYPFKHSFCLGLFLFIGLKMSFAMAPKRNWDQAIDHVIKRYSLRTEPELKKYFQNAHISYPPKELAFLAFKKEQKMELWAKDEKSDWHYIHTYPLTAKSGQLGPKLRENDKQIPEGVYRLTMFNPYSAMHLSMQINYPNQFDKIHAIQDGRTQLGGNIFLHGKDLSVGCLAIGDHAIDQLFLLVRRVGLGQTKVIIAPNDLRVHQAATNTLLQPKWVNNLYKQISSELHAFPKKHMAKL
jgi:hypothetical protein